MSEISPTFHDRPVHGPEDVLALYQGAGDHSQIGVEIEQTLYRPDTLETMKAPQSERMSAQGLAAGVPVHHEPSATSLELATDPFAPGDLPALIAQIEARFDYLRRLSREEGMALSPFGHLPHVFPADHEVVRKERFQTFFNPPRADMVDVFKSFSNFMNIQVSVSYADADHLLRMVRLVVALEPLFFLITGSDCGFFEHKKIDYILGPRLISVRGINGGIPGFYYTARTGEELIRAHADYTLHHPHMFAYFDFEGKLRRLPPGQWVAYNDLERLNLGPRTMLNYRQAQSESWRRAVNISPLLGADGQVTGHRAEFAPFQTGLMHQRATAPLLAALIAFDEDFQARIGEALEECGIDLGRLDPHVLESNFLAAREHGNRFDDISFGTKTIGHLARAAAEGLEQAYGGGVLAPYAAPAIHILRTGRPDWRVYRERFPSLDSVKAYLRDFPDLAAPNPALVSGQSCADLAF